MHLGSMAFFEIVPLATYFIIFNEHPKKKEGKK